MIAVVVVQTVLLAGLAVLVAALLRSHAAILRRLHEAGFADPDHAGAPPAVGPQDLPFGVQPGVSLPRDNPTDGFDVAGTTPSGEVASVQVVGAPQNTLVAFLSGGCLTCEHFWEAFREGVTLPTGTRLVVVTKGPDQESPSTVRRLAPTDVPVVMSDQTWSAYSVPLSPYFVLVEGPSGRVRGEGAASSWPQVHALLQQSLDDQDTGPRGDGAFRESRADAELMAAGIHPGHPSLYPTTPPGEVREQDPSSGGRV